MGRLATTLGVTNNRLLTTAAAKSKVKHWSSNPNKGVGSGAQIYYLNACLNCKPDVKYIFSLELCFAPSKTGSAICNRCCFGEPNAYCTANEASYWLALRASVLRRVVSQSARPGKHRAHARSARAAQLGRASSQDRRICPAKEKQFNVCALQIQRTKASCGAA